ncbi:MAG: tetratricopeptide repeat protein, partial [Anaerolineales bacterium]|nr:tetratricopeptide repeat protein [Anaerolineales bacterium]
GLFQQSLAAYEQLGNVHGQATSHNLIANGYFARGELPLADRHYRQSLDLFVQMGHVYSQVLVNNNLGGIALKQGRWEAALGYYQRAVRQMEQIQGSLWVLGALHLNRGNVLIQQGALTEAEEVLVTAESCFAQVQIQDFLPELYRLFAELYGRRGVWETAVSYGDRSLQLARELEMPREEGHTLRIMGQIALWQQQEEVAHHHFEQSQRLLTAANDAYELAKTQLALARLYVQQRQGAEARRLLLAAEAVFARQEAAFDWQQVRQLLVELDN